MTKPPRSRFRIGVLVPYTNTNLEPDLELMRPPDTSFHYTRIAGYSIKQTPDEEEMAAMGEADITDAVRLISAIRPDVVLYGCTSATLSRGVSFDRKLSADIQEITGATTITAAGSLISGLQALGVRNVAFASPYVGEINNLALSFFNDSGFHTVSHTDIGRDLSSHEQGELTPEDVFELAVRADHMQAEAIVLSCTDLRAVEAIPLIEAALDKPVISSNQAMLFAVSKLLNLPSSEKTVGRLFNCV